MLFRSEAVSAKAEHRRRLLEERAKGEIGQGMSELRRERPCFVGFGERGGGAREAMGCFRFIGIERDPDYFELACARIRAIVDSLHVC